METALIGTLFCLASCGIAIWANRRLRTEARLPMQWWLGGEVTWSAPRPIALAFVPSLAVLVFASLTVLSVYTPPRPGQEGMVIPSLFAVGFIILGGSGRSILRSRGIQLTDETLSSKARHRPGGEIDIFLQALGRRRAASLAAGCSPAGQFHPCGERQT
jgi:hypothetical protein